jgi:predicted nucleic acid-binding protein
MTLTRRLPMGSPACATDARQLIADASVWINLAASGRLEDVLEALSAPIGISDIALGELERGLARGYDTHAQVEALVKSGRIEALALEPADEALFFSLVAGGAADTLDDGEAATLALAVRLSGVAAIDERKATALAARKFPGLIIRSTTDLLFEALPYEGDGHGPLSDALFAALKGARMRVPFNLQARVAEVLGLDRTRLCLSLPSSLRIPAPADISLRGL